jgi:hypothetical protein
VTSLLLAESRIQPLVVLLDDLQWADQPSQLLLDFWPGGCLRAPQPSWVPTATSTPVPGPALAALAAVLEPTQ